VGIVRYSPANRLLIAQKFDWEFLADYHAGWSGQDSYDASQGHPGVIFA